MNVEQTLKGASNNNKRIDWSLKGIVLVLLLISLNKKNGFSLLARSLLLYR